MTSSTKGIYQRKWVQEHPGQRAAWLRSRLRRQKIAAIVAAGGKCLDCGYNDLDHPEVFDFDHRDPTQKHPRLRFGVSTNKLPKVLREAELDKCDLVCANCHRIRTQDRTH